MGGLRGVLSPLVYNTPMILLQNQFLRAEFAPEAGASLVSLSTHQPGGWTRLTRLTPPPAIQARDAWSMASFILAPFSNFIPGGRFEFAGQSLQLGCNLADSAIHGDAYRHPWQVTAARPDRLVCRLDSTRIPDFNFPFSLALEATYTLAGLTLESALALTNTGPRPMPAGLGFHPFFNRILPGPEAAAATLQFQARGVYPPLPSGPMQPVPPHQDFSTPVVAAGRDLNHCFGGWDGRARIHYPAAGLALDLECSSLFGHLVVFIPPGEDYFCVEPVSHANNAFNLAAHGQPDTGLRILAPGETLSGSFKITLLPA